jgi:hypothetical protein
VTRQARRRRGRQQVRRIEYRRPPLADYQTAALFNDKRYGVIEATTKAGKTVGALAWLTEGACLEGSDGWLGAWVAPIYRQAAIAYARFKRFVDPEYYRANDSKLEIELPNRARMRFLGADNPDSIYGEDYHRAVIDEASRCKEAAYHAVRSTLTATRGPIRIIGNVRGTKNWNFALARKAESGEPNMHYAKITAHDAVAAGILSAEEIEEARAQLPDAVFKELYLAIPAEDGSNPFGLEAIRGCLITDERIIAQLSLRTPVVWGIDLAKSHDWTVMVALDATGVVCRLIRFQMPWRETMAFIRRTVGTTPAIIDSTGVGDPIVEILQNGITPLIRASELPADVALFGATASVRRAELAARAAEEEDRRNRELQGLVTACPNIRGYLFTRVSKQQLMERLAYVLQVREVRYGPGTTRESPNQAPQVLQNELESFEFEYSATSRAVRYAAPAGLHDDCVMALALAVEGRALAVRTSYAAGETI